MASRSRPATAARSSTYALVRKICSPRTLRGSGTPIAGLRASRPSRTARPRISDSTRWAWRTVDALFPDRDSWATPGSDALVGDVAEPHRAPGRQDVHAQRDLVAAVRRRLEVDLAVQPLAGPLGDGDPGPLGVDVGAGEHRGGDRVQPRLRVGLLVEVPRVLLARRVAVARPPAPVGPPRDADHRQPHPTPPPTLAAARRPRATTRRTIPAVRRKSATEPPPAISSRRRPIAANILVTTYQ
jgi:hypothetical protein